MAKSLSKVQKKVTKKKGTTGALHENSRDAQRLRRAGARSEKLEKLAHARAKGKNPLCESTSVKKRLLELTRFTSQCNESRYSKKR